MAFGGAALTLKKFDNPRQIALHLGRDYQKQFMYIAYRLSPPRKYKTFNIPKKSGGVRTICAPRTALLNLQKELKRLIEADYEPKPHVHGFVSNHQRSIVSNSRQHLRKKWVLNLDLRDYFETIHFGRITGRLRAPPYNYKDRIADFIAHVACYETHKVIDGETKKTSVLMPGGALSPLLSNIVSDRLDSELSRYCRQFGCSYTRYADDITISSNRNRFPGRIARFDDPDDRRSLALADELQDIIEKNGFQINHKKTRLQTQQMRQEVTGLVVNASSNVKRNFVRQIRAMLYDWKENGLSAATEKHFAQRPNRGRLSEYEVRNFEWVVRGKIEFIRQVKGATDSVFQKLAAKYNELAVNGGKIFIPIVETEQILNGSVWYLEHESDDGGCGTCFVLGASTLVTCNHCVGENLQVFPAKAPKIPFDANVVVEDQINDLAVLEVSGLPTGLVPSSCLELASAIDIAALKVGDSVQAVGFPGDMNAESLSVFGSSIVRFSKRTLDGTVPTKDNVMVLDGGTSEGMSGGPVLHQGKVVGVIIRGPGHSAPTAKSEAVLSTHLTSLINK